MAMMMIVFRDVMPCSLYQTYMRNLPPPSSTLKMKAVKFFRKVVKRSTKPPQILLKNLDETETRNNCAGEAHQQFSRQTDNC